MCRSCSTCLFFFNDTATTEIYTLSLHDALPICPVAAPQRVLRAVPDLQRALGEQARGPADGGEIGRAHVELQSQSNLVCRLLLEKKKKNKHHSTPATSTS